MTNIKKILGSVFIVISIFFILLILTMYNDLRNADNVFQLIGEVALYSYFIAILIVLSIVFFIIGIVLFVLSMKANKNKEEKEVYIRNK